jgi:hypothetical protein
MAKAVGNSDSLGLQPPRPPSTLPYSSPRPLPGVNLDGLPGGGS